MQRISTVLMLLGALVFVAGVPAAAFSFEPFPPLTAGNQVGASAPGVALADSDLCSCGGCGNWGMPRCPNCWCRNTFWNCCRSDRYFNCWCNGSYKYPVPPQSTYLWPGIYSQQTITSPCRPCFYPPLQGSAVDVESVSSSLNKPTLSRSARSFADAMKRAARRMTTAGRELPKNSRK
ncbi:MAG: hypothetical protein JXB10_02645 [Pirellulales bacterium]|nr:hypothetical protein [Pirellulales bacterium]